jgi:ABC-type phosphate transport system substrate-binding protein
MIVRRLLAFSILPRVRGWRLRAATALVAGALALPAVGRAQSRTARPLAIVVHTGVPVNALSFAELRRIFLGEQQFWPDRSKVTLLVRAPTAYERSLVLDRIYKMDEDRFRQYWIGKMFRAEVAAGPKIVYSSEMALTLVSAIRGSITFIPFSAVTPEVKVLRIDGKLPSEPGYPLQ